MEKCTDPTWSENQLTKEEAIAMYEGNEWKQWNDEKKFSFQMLQHRLCMPFGEFLKAAEIVLGRPVFTHEFAFREGLIREWLGDKPMPTFDEIIGLIPKDKLIIVSQ